MIDLTLFHEYPDKKYPAQDNLNRRSGRLACFLLEWTGWYNQNIAQRLLGHYRLFQLYKKDPDHVLRRMPLSQAYILHYRSSHFIKYSISRMVSLLYSIPTLGKHYYIAVEIETFNGSLINENADILQEFLLNADKDFTTAFLHAMRQLSSLSLNKTSSYSKPPSAPLLIQFQQHHNNYNTFYSINQFNTHPPIQPGTKGKEKGVFSKKQLLILFDLLSEASKLEKIDISKPNRYEDYAALLQALTGKGKDAWIEEFNDHRNKNLYEFHTAGELKQLISTLTNLAELFRKAGFRSIASLADKKIRELENHKKD